MWLPSSQRMPQVVRCFDVCAAVTTARCQVREKEAWRARTSSPTTGCEVQGKPGSGGRPPPPWEVAEGGGVVYWEEEPVVGRPGRNVCPQAEALRFSGSWGGRGCRRGPPGRAGRSKKSLVQAVVSPPGRRQRGVVWYWEETPVVGRPGRAACTHAEDAWFLGP